MRVNLQILSYNYAFFLFFFFKKKTSLLDSNVRQHSTISRGFCRQQLIAILPATNLESENADKTTIVAVFFVDTAGLSSSWR